MDSNQFDRLSRLVGSRRSVGLALGATTLLGLADTATSKKRKRKNCKRFKIRPPRCDGTFCSKTKISTCAPKYHRCRCREGTVCLRNGNCGLSCEPECPAGCSCSTGEIADEPKVCVQDEISCDEVPTPCETTAGCPTGTICLSLQCMDGRRQRCVPICNPLT